MPEYFSNAYLLLVYLALAIEAWIKINVCTHYFIICLRVKQVRPVDSE